MFLKQIFYTIIVATYWIMWEWVTNIFLIQKICNSIMRIRIIFLVIFHCQMRCCLRMISIEDLSWKLLLKIAHRAQRLRKSFAKRASAIGVWFSCFYKKRKRIKEKHDKERWRLRKIYFHLQQYCPWIIYSF